MAGKKTADTHFPINPRIGERLRKARRKKGWTLDELASLVGGMRKAELSTLENGKRSCRAETLYALCRVLRVKMDTICSLKDDDPT